MDELRESAAAIHALASARRTTVDSLIDNPSLAMACNAYRRQHGAWPEAVRVGPEYFVTDVASMRPDALRVLASLMDITVTERERSPRLTVLGAHGELTYNQGVEEADWDQEPFHKWIHAAAAAQGVAIRDE
jgi:hypothetical protein